jgi:hypothetical protein
VAARSAFQGRDNYLAKLPDAIAEMERVHAAVKSGRKCQAQGASLPPGVGGAPGRYRPFRSSSCLGPSSQKMTDAEREMTVAAELAFSPDALERCKSL